MSELYPRNEADREAEMAAAETWNRQSDYDNQDMAIASTERVAEAEYAHTTADAKAEQAADTATDTQWSQFAGAEFAPGNRIKITDHSEGPQTVTINARTAKEIVENPVNIKAPLVTELTGGQHADVAPTINEVVGPHSGVPADPGELPAPATEEPKTPVGV